LAHIRHHVWHRVHHTFHALSANSTACQVLPNVLAAIALGVIAPAPQASPPHAEGPAVVDPSVLSPDTSSMGITWAGFGGGIWAQAPTVSHAPADPAADTTPGPLGAPISSLVASEILAQPALTQMAGLYPAVIDPAPLVMAMNVEPAAGLTESVPEPSALAILAAAACVAGLIKRRSAGRRSLRARKRPPSPEPAAAPCEGELHH
jgi:hypothetical protein